VINAHARGTPSSCLRFPPAQNGQPVLPRWLFLVFQQLQDGRGLGLQSLKRGKYSSSTSCAMSSLIIAASPQANLFDGKSHETSQLVGKTERGDSLENLAQPVLMATAWTIASTTSV
jgi:hypothetical protein